MTAPFPLYHGTRQGFSRGGLLLPRAEHGGAGTAAPVNPGRQVPADASRWVYGTGSLDLAWVYAWHAVGRGRPKVLVLHPHGAPRSDPEHSPAADAWRCEWATVTRVLTDPTVTEQEARDGWQPLPRQAPPARPGVDPESACTIVMAPVSDRGRNRRKPVSNRADRVAVPVLHLTSGRRVALDPTTTAADLEEAATGGAADAFSGVGVTYLPPDEAPHNRGSA